MMTIWQGNIDGIDGRVIKKCLKSQVSIDKSSYEYQTQIHLDMKGVQLGCCISGRMHARV